MLPLACEGSHNFLLLIEGLNVIENIEGFKFMVRTMFNPLQRGKCAMQDATFDCGLYVIEAHDLKAIFLAIVQSLQDKLWRAFFLDPLKQWDHKSHKVLTINPIIVHMSMDEPLVFFGINLVALFLGCYFAKV
jgi:hypothetical protein